MLPKHLIPSILPSSRNLRLVQRPFTEWVCFVLFVCLGVITQLTGRNQENRVPRGGPQAGLAISHLQEGAVPQAAPDFQHRHTVKAVEWTAEHHTGGCAPGAVLGSTMYRALNSSTHPSLPRPLTNVATETRAGLKLPFPPHIYLTNQSTKSGFITQSDCFVLKRHQGTTNSFRGG